MTRPLFEKALDGHTFVDNNETSLIVDTQGNIIDTSGEWISYSGYVEGGQMFSNQNEYFGDFEDDYE